MTKILTILSIFLATIAFGQNVQVDTFRLKESEKIKDIQSGIMNFPIVQTENERVDSIINFDLKNRFTSNDYPNEPLDSTLIKWAGDQIVYIDFKVTYNENGILSLNISAEGCGAYCSQWTDYFNYSTITGDPLNIAEIIDTTGAFRERVYKDLKIQYKRQKLELVEMLHDPESGLDLTTYEWALEYYQDCENSFDLETYAIYREGLEIIEFCHLPNAIKNLTPILTLKYGTSEIKKYLKIKN